MAFKVPCLESQKEPDSPRFKLKRSWEEIKLARALLEENSAAMGSDAEETLSTDEALEAARVIIHSGAPEEEPGLGMDELQEMLGMASGDALKSKMKMGFTFPHASIMSHPWHIIDYHLYLCAVEKNKDLRSRRNGMHLFDGGDCRSFAYHEFLSDRTLSSCNGSDGTRLLFSALPIADRTHFADRNPAFAGRHYILGFDLTDKVFYARYFDWIPEHMDDLWCVWEDGFDMYSVTIEDLTCLLRSTIDEGEMHVGMGILSASPYCISLGMSDDPGLEIIIVILFCQWLLDFAEVLFDQKAPSLLGFKEHLIRYMEECRMILQRASYRAWFAARDGGSKEKYKHSSTLNQYINDLYTYEKSAQLGSLCGRSWHAPGIDTCNRIRKKDRVQRKEETERRLMDLFVPPDYEKTVAESSPVNDSQSIVSKSEESLLFYTPSPSGTPRTPTPPVQNTPPLSERSPSPGSPGLVTPANERYDDLEVTEYHNIPLSLLLKRSLDLVEAQPELDTLTHRGQFGALLTNIGVGVQRLPVDNNTIAPTMGYKNNDWKLETDVPLGSETPFVRRLLPSPVID